MAIIRVPVTISLDEESFKIYEKMKPGERSQKIREFLKSMEPPKPKEPLTMQKVLSEREFVKKEKSDQKTISTIMSSGTYSHENELKSLYALKRGGASKTEIRAIRLKYQEKREEAERMAKTLIQERKGKHLERLSSEHYVLARQNLNEEQGRPSPEDHENYEKIRGPIHVKRRNNKLI